MKSSFFFLFCYLFYSSSLLSQEVDQRLGCVHKQTCHLLNELIAEKGTDPYKTPILKSIIEIEGDPHFFDPQVGHFKELLRPQYLLLPPQEFFPWVSKVKAQRDKLGKNSYILKIDQKIAESYKLEDQIPWEELGHFWIYPEVLCQFRKDTLKQLEIWKLGNLIKNKDYLSCTENSSVKNLKKALLSPGLKGKTFVFIHSALRPLFEKLGARTMALRGPGHHAKIDVQVLKKLHQIRVADKREKTAQQNKSSIVWIIEENLQKGHHSHQSVEDKSDSHLSINPQGREGTSPDSTLIELAEKLKLL